MYVLVNVCHVVSDFLTNSILAGTYIPFFNQLKAINDETHAARLVKPRDNSANSDHFWFSNYCPSIFILTMGHPYGGYHDPYDTCEACGLSHYNDYLKMILQLVGLEEN